MVPKKARTFVLSGRPYGDNEFREAQIMQTVRAVAMSTSKSVLSKPLLVNVTFLP